MNDKPDLSPAVMDAIAAGRKIEAIKLLREDLGIGLKDAKILIDAAVADYRAANPGARRESSSGNFGWMIGGAVLAAVLYYVFGKFS